MVLELGFNKVSKNRVVKSCLNNFYKNAYVTTDSKLNIIEPCKVTLNRVVQKTQCYFLYDYAFMKFE